MCACRRVVAESSTQESSVPKKTVLRGEESIEVTQDDVDRLGLKAPNATSDENKVVVTDEDKDR
jgi:hypothetical protein